MKKSGDFKEDLIQKSGIFKFPSDFMVILIFIFYITPVFAAKQPFTFGLLRWHGQLFPKLSKLLWMSLTAILVPTN